LSFEVFGANVAPMWIGQSVPTFAIERVVPGRIQRIQTIYRIQWENLVGCWRSSLFSPHELSPLALAVGPFYLYKRTSRNNPTNRRQNKSFFIEFPPQAGPIPGLSGSFRVIP
jgi:hypothetical protein